MTVATNGVSLVEKIRQEVTKARQAGDPVPGRPTLARMFDTTEHQVRKVLAELDPSVVDADDASLHPLATSEVTDQLTAVDAGVAGDQVASPDASAGVAGGKAFSFIGLMLGAVVSVAFNVLAARIPPGDAPKGWQPSLTAEVFAAVWPLFLLISVEVVARVRWPKGRWWMVPKVTGAVAVALFGAVISYQHIQAVLLTWNYNILSAGVGPLVVDGLMVVAGFGLLAENHAKKEKAA